MINLNIEQNGDSVNAVYMLQESDRIDNLTLGMLVNNRITGVARISPVQIKKDKYFQYNITNKVSMRDYLGETVQRDKLLQIFLQIAETLLEAEEYMINPTSFLLDEQNIYVDKNTGEIAFVCIPLLSVVNDGNICNFFKNVLFSSQFDLEENGDYVGKLITFLNPKTYTLSGFIKELQEMLGKASEIIDTDEPVKSIKSEETPAAKESEEIIKAEEAMKMEETVETEEIHGIMKEASETEKVPFLIRSKTSQKIYVAKDEFLLGSEQDSVDYWIDDNQAVSRNHAKIVRHEKEYFVIDNDSRNHTYLNGVLVESGEEHFVPHGAVLRFADEDFEFKMHE